MDKKFDESKTKGNMAVQKKDYIEAIKHYSEALVVDASSPIIHANISLCHRLQKQMRQAKYHAEQAIVLHPAWSRGHQRLAEVLKECEYFAKAIAEYERALSMADEAKSTAELKEARDKCVASHEEEKKALFALAAPPPAGGDAGGDVQMLLLRAVRPQTMPIVHYKDLAVVLSGPSYDQRVQLKRFEEELEAMLKLGHKFGLKDSVRVTVPGPLVEDLRSNPTLAWTLSQTVQLTSTRNKK